MKPTPPPPPRKPRKYLPELDQLAENYASLGADDKQIAKFLRVSEGAVAKWKRKHPGFHAALLRGRSVNAASVDVSLLKRAKGYDVEVERPVSAGGKVIIAKYMQHVPPDVHALKLWHERNDRDAARIPAGSLPPGGESDEDVIAIIMGRLEEIKERHEAPVPVRPTPMLPPTMGSTQELGSIGRLGLRVVK